MFTLYDAFNHTAQLYKDKPAVIFMNKTYTFAMVSEKINSLSNCLFNLGVKSGMTIGFLLRNSLNFYTIFFACQKLGCVSFPLNFRLNASEQRDHLELGECDVLIYDDMFSDTVSELKQIIERDMLYISTEKNEEITLANLYEMGNPQWDTERQVRPEDPALYLLTGGTSSNSKIAVASQQKLLLRAIMPRLYDAIDLYGNDNYMLFNPMFHRGGVDVFVPLALTGGCVTLIERMDVENILKTIDNYKVTKFSLIPPALCHRIMRFPDLKKYDLSSVVRVVFGGGASSASIVEDIFDIFPKTQILSKTIN